MTHHKTKIKIFDPACTKYSLYFFRNTLALFSKKHKALIMGKVNQPGLKKRFPVVDGIFYPEDPEIITKTLASWGLKKNTAASGGQAILVPHGAWDITGGIVARAFSSVQNKTEKISRNISTVLLLGTCHHPCEEGIFLSESDSFDSLLGDLPVNQKLNRELVSCSTLISINDIPHLSEHSLEVLLPFLKYCFPEVRIVPILMCGERSALISALAKALRLSFESYMEESLIVISSIISRNPDPSASRAMAGDFKSILEAMDTKTFLERITEQRVTACAAAPLGALLESGLLGGRYFSSLCSMVQSVGEDGDTFCYEAFGV